MASDRSAREEAEHDDQAGRPGLHRAAWERGAGRLQRCGQDALGDGAGLQGDPGRHQDATAANLMPTLTTAHTQNNLKVAMHRAIKAYRLSIIDVIGYLAMNREQAKLFFAVIAA